MSDWDAAEEERIKRTLSKASATAKRAAGGTGMASPTHSPSPSFSGVGSPRSGVAANPAAQELDHVRKQKLNVQGQVNSAKRELDEVNAELDKLNRKKVDLEALLARRQEQLESLVVHMQELEKTIHAEQPVAPKPVVHASAASSYNASSSSQPVVQSSVASAHVKKVFEDMGADSDAEAARLMKTMSRAKGSPAPAQRTMHTMATTGVSDDERTAREVEERRRREENERRRREEEEASRTREELKRRAKEEAMESLMSRPGVQTEFVFSECFDFDAECSLVADFTGWAPVPMTRADDSLDFSITVPLEQGRTYFYYYSVDGKVEIDKKKPTGLGNGILCNRLNV